MPPGTAMMRRPGQFASYCHHNGLLSRHIEFRPPATKQAKELVFYRLRAFAAKEALAAWLTHELCFFML